MTQVTDFESVTPRIRGALDVTSDSGSASSECVALREHTPAMALPVFDTNLSDDELDAMMDNATHATNFLKAIGHEGRLMILCHLATGEKSVTELEELLSARQAAVSQQLGRLRLEGLVQPRREGKTIYYSLTDDRCKRIISLVYDLFCKTD